MEKPVCAPLSYNLCAAMPRSRFSITYVCNARMNEVNRCEQKNNWRSRAVAGRSTTPTVPPKAQQRREESRQSKKIYQKLFGERSFLVGRRVTKQNRTSNRYQKSFQKVFFILAPNLVLVKKTIIRKKNDIHNNI
jgi:hypothetical protein